MRLVELRLMLVVAGLALGVGSLAIARSTPGASFGGGSLAAGVVLLGAGWSLLACGAVAGRAGRRAASGRSSSPRAVPGSWSSSRIQAWARRSCSPSVC